MKSNRSGDFTLPAKVAILYSFVKKNYFPTFVQYKTEKDAYKEAGIVADYINKLGINCRLIAADSNLISNIRKYQPDLLLNLVGSIYGKEYLAALVPGIAEMIDIPCTGADFMSESLGYDKYQLKKRLEDSGVSVPRCFLIDKNADTIPDSISFPVIVKLNSIHGSVEITKKALCKNRGELVQRVNYLKKIYRDNILVEEFIPGEEFSVISFEYRGLSVYAAKNIFGKSENPNFFATFDLQWSDEEIGFEKFTDKNLTRLIKIAYPVSGMRDYGKFDIRRNRQGQYYFIDANTNPAFGPKESECAMATVMDLYGFSFEEILKRLFTNVLERSKK